MRIKYEAEKELIRWKYKSEMQHTYKLLCALMVLLLYSFLYAIVAAAAAAIAN